MRLEQRKQHFWLWHFVGLGPFSPFLNASFSANTRSSDLYQSKNKRHLYGLCNTVRIRYISLLHEKLFTKHRGFLPLSCSKSHFGRYNTRRWHFHKILSGAFDSMHKNTLGTNAFGAEKTTFLTLTFCGFGSVFSFFECIVLSQYEEFWPLPKQK